MAELKADMFIEVIATGETKQIKVLSQKYKKGVWTTLYVTYDDSKYTPTEVKSVEAKEVKEPVLEPKDELGDDITIDLTEQEIASELEQLRNDYKELAGKNCPNKFRKDKNWLIKNIEKLID